MQQGSSDEGAVQARVTASRLQVGKGLLAGRVGVGSENHLRFLDALRDYELVSGGREERLQQMNPEKSVLRGARINPRTEHDSHGTERGHRLHQPRRAPYGNLELALLRSDLLRTGAGGPRHPVHAVRALSGKLRKLELVGIAADTLVGVPRNLRRCARSAEGMTERWRRRRSFRGLFQIHVEIEIAAVGQIELDGAASVDALGALEVEVHEVVSGYGKVLFPDRHRKLRVERNWRRHRRASARRRQLGVAQCHGQVDLIANLLDTPRTGGALCNR